MKVRIEWAGDAKFVGRSGYGPNFDSGSDLDAGHSIVMDGPEDHGGKNQGPRPMETLLIGMGGCTSFDVVNILKKARQDVVDCIAEISAERADAVPAVFTKIHIHFVVSGKDLKPSQVKKAVELSAEKYCSASIMLARGGVEITHSFETKSI